MTTYQLQWSDNVEADEPRIVTTDGQHVYQFETANMDDAEAVVRTFKLLESKHDFSNAIIKEVK